MWAGVRRVPGRWAILRAGAIAVALVAAGCGLLPGNGPNAIGVGTHVGASNPYWVVKLSPQVIQALATYEPDGLAGMFRSSKPPPAIVFHIGDVVAVTIFEAAAGGLFIPIEAGVRPGNFVTLPNQTVDNDGNISVPYAGAVRADGRTNVDIQNDVVARIRNRAIEPQVVVTLATQNTSLISVFGDVRNSIRYPAAGLGAKDRITDAITRAGGIQNQGWNTWVMLERDGKRGTVPMANLIYEPDNNIYVQPGDRIYVYTEDQKFMAFGASGQQGEFQFAAWRINLAEAVAKAGGLLDLQADPGAVFLYRSEPRHVVEQFGADLNSFPAGDIVPVIFTADFRDPSGYFLATKLQMRNGDVIFASNAQSYEITKFVNFLNTMMSTATNSVTTYQIVRNPQGPPVSTIVVPATP